MRFTKYFAVAIATLAFQTMCLPTLPVSVRELSVSRRDLASISKLLEMAKNLASLPKLVPVPKASNSEKRSPVEEGTIEIENEPLPVSGSEYNKKSTAPEPEPELEPEEFEEVLTRRATTMDPTVGIPQDLPSGIVMFMIVFMFYAMITAISMKDAD